MKLVLQKLLPMLDDVDRSQWLEQVRCWKEEYPLTYNGEGALKPQRVIEKLREITRGNAVVVTDVGQHQMWVAQYYRFRRPGTLISSGGLGTMGFGLPAAVGAQLGLTGDNVILVTGDGSFQMNMQELATIVEQELPIKIIILNNQVLGMVRQLQEFYCQGRYMATEFKFNPDFVALARAYGIGGYNITNEEELETVLPEALAQSGPAIIDCRVCADANVSPMVLAGKGIDEAIDC